MISFNYAQHLVPYQLMGLISLCPSVMPQAGRMITANSAPCRETHVHSASHEVVGRGEMAIVDEHPPC